LHELSIAESILDVVRTEMSSRSNCRPMRVGVRIGAMAAIDAESLGFCFESIVQGSDFDGLRLEVRVTPAERQCLMCDQRYEVLEFEASCPACGSADAIPLGGDELDIEYLEVDDGAIESKSEGARRE